MKKFIISSLALASATVASANQNALVAASLDNSSEVKLERSDVKKANRLNDVKMVTASVKKAEINADATVSRAGETPEINPLYRFPNGTFFSFFTFDANGEPYVYPNVAVAPAYCENIWMNDSWYTAADGRPTWLKESDKVSYQWQLIGNENAIIEEATTFNFPIYNEASPKKGQGYYTPVLTVNGKEYQYGQEGQDRFYPQFFEYGGKGSGDPETFEYLSGIFQTELGVPVENFQDGGVRPYNTSSDDFFGNFTGGAFSYPGSAEDPIENWFASDEPNSELAADNIKVIGFSQIFPKPAAPYALSKISFPVKITCAAEAQIRITLAAVTDKDGVNLQNPIYTYDYTFPAAINDKTVSVEIPVTSINEINDELDYTLIDSEMMLIISGFAGNDAISAFNPLIAGFVYDRTYQYFSPEPQTIMAVLQVGTGENAGIAFNQTNYLAGFKGQIGTTYATYNSFALELDAEYPYIKPLVNLVTEEEYDPKKEVYSVGLSNEENVSVIAMLCPGDLENVTIADMNGDELPAWLASEAISAPEFEAAKGAEPVDEGQKYFYLAFGLNGDAPATPVNTYVKVEYKGQSSVFYVTTGDPAGIDNVTEVKDAVLDWNAPVYNVMGQKVSKGFTGIAIQNGNKFIVK